MLGSRLSPSSCCRQIIHRHNLGRSGLFPRGPRQLDDVGDGKIPVLERVRRQQYRSFAKVSSLSLQSKKRKGEKITVVTAYDYPSGLHAARAGIDILLVGDSVSMVELGHETTQPVTVDEMIHHCKAVKRGVDDGQTPKQNTPLLLGDMPFGSYEYDDTDIALRNAYRFIKEAGMDGVKLEVSGCMQ